MQAPRFDESLLRVLLAGLMVMVSVCPVAFAGTGVLFVDDDAPPGGDGQTWATARRTPWRMPAWRAPSVRFGSHRASTSRIAMKPIRAARACASRRSRWSTTWS